MSEFEPKPRDITAPEGYRSMGFWNEATQNGLYDTEVGVAGIGGAGYLASVALAHMGIQRFNIADPEPMENVNSNRVLGATTETYGQNKAEVLRDEILRINPGATVRVYNKGIDRDNVSDFVGDSRVLIDALELSMPDLGTMLAREARKRGIPVVNGEYIGHGAQVTSFDPKSKMTFERYMGIKGGETADLDDVAKQKIETSRFVSYIPRYADLSTLKAMEEGAPLPSNMLGAGVAAQMIAAEVLKHVRTDIGEPTLPPTFAPQVRWMDSYTGESGRTRHPRLSFYKHVVVAALRNSLGLHERASYTAEERASRGDVSEQTYGVGGEANREVTSVSNS